MADASRPLAQILILLIFGNPAPGLSENLQYLLRCVWFKISLHLKALLSPKDGTRGGRDIMKGLEPGKFSHASDVARPLPLLAQSGH